MDKERAVVCRYCLKNNNIGFWVLFDVASENIVQLEEY